MMTPVRMFLVAAMLLVAGTTVPRFAHSQSPTQAPPASVQPQTALQTAAGAAAASDEAPAAGPAEDNPFGLRALWQNGDVVARGTLLILAFMSVSTWYVVITKFAQQSRLAARGRAANKSFWTAASLAEGADRLGRGSVYAHIARAGMAAADHHEGTLVEKVDVSTWITLSLDRATTGVNSRLQGGLAWLATIASVSPFVGLFGTVWGIYHALTAIGIAGQASIDKVAGPVGEALIMTAIGLATAVPAVLGYNFLLRRNKAIMEEVRGFTADLYAVLLSGRRVGGGVSVAGRDAGRTVARKQPEVAPSWR